LTTLFSYRQFGGVDRKTDREWRTADGARGRWWILGSFTRVLLEDAGAGTWWKSILEAFDVD